MLAINVDIVIVITTVIDIEHTASKIRTELTILINLTLLPAPDEYLVLEPLIDLSSQNRGRIEAGIEAVFMS